MQRLLPALFIFWFSTNLLASDPYDTFSALPHPENQPRVLNTEDVPELKVSVPLELVTLEGDFNRDGKEDVAVSGLYDLVEGPRKYFLLVATFKEGKPILLLYKEFDHPIFLHATGTTGEGDPKTEAFSFTYCWNCERGEDVNWNPKSSQFEIVRWEKRSFQSIAVATPLPEIPEAIVDDSLKIVGALPEVVAYVNKVKKRNGKFGTRVEWDSPADLRVWVSILDKTNNKEKLYRKYLVSEKEKKILKRQ